MFIVYISICKCVKHTCLYVYFIYVTLFLRMSAWTLIQFKINLCWWCTCMCMRDVLLSMGSVPCYVASLSMGNMCSLWPCRPSTSWNGCGYNIPHIGPWPCRPSASGDGCGIVPPYRPLNDACCMGVLLDPRYDYFILICLFLLCLVISSI